MSKKTRNETVQALQNARRSKGGFTLTELSVVLALVAIVTAMIVSFSVMMNRQVQSERNEYNFLEDYATVKDAVYKWASENDVEGHEFKVAKYTVNDNELYFDDDDAILNVGDDSIEDLDTIESVSFDDDGKLIKCIVKSNSGRICEFVFAVRWATVGGGA